MFGYVVGNTAVMEPAEKARYGAIYCGLCHEIGRRSGQRARLSLTYDLTFLILLLNSLYEPPEQTARLRCAIHPAKRRPSVTTRFTEYAADMNVYLSYYKCMDDWTDEGKRLRRAYARTLEKPCEAIRERWPRQCADVRASLEALAEVERAPNRQPDEAINSFGALMASLFVYDADDLWARTLYAFGGGLGRFVYLMDAALDYAQDVKRGAYNPLRAMEVAPNALRGTLSLLIGEAARAFETLPLEADLPLLRNILYGGVWQSYNAAFEPPANKEKTK